MYENNIYIQLVWRQSNAECKILPWQFLFISLLHFFSAFFCILYFLSISALSNFHIILFFCQHIYWFYTDGIHVRGGRPAVCRKIYGLLYKNFVTYICIELINKNLDVLKFLHWKIWNVLVWQFVYHVSALLYDKWIPVNYFFILFFSHYFHMPLFYAIIRINYIIAFLRHIIIWLSYIIKR